MLIRRFVVKKAMYPLVSLPLYWNFIFHCPTEKNVIWIHFFFVFFRLQKKRSHLKVRWRIEVLNTIALEFWVWILNLILLRQYHLKPCLHLCEIPANICPGCISLFTGIYLTFKVTSDVPVTHVAANTDSTVPSPAVVTISCNQCFSVNKWLPSGKNLRPLYVGRHATRSIAWPTDDADITAVKETCNDILRA